MQQPLSPANKRIRTLLLVIFSGAACALALSVFLLYNFGPTGQYLIKEALLAPDLVTSLSYNDTNHKTGGMSHFVFNDIEFSYYDSATRQQRKIPITPEAYSAFYDSVVSDKSLLNPPQEVIAAFSKGMPATLSIMVRTESHAAWQDETKVFQKVDFARGDDAYRIELHEETTSSDLVYFFHAGIYKKVIDLFTKQ